jgi:hypothetical protein
MAFLQADSPRPRRRRRRRRRDADAFEKAESKNALTTKTGIPEDAEREGRKGKEGGDGGSRTGKLDWRLR